MTTTTTTSATSSAASSILTSLGAGSGVDTSSLVSQLVAASSLAKNTALTARSTKVTAQISGISTLKNGLSTFATSLQTLVAGGTLQTLPDSSDTTVVAASAISGQSMGEADSSLIVQQLAAAQSIASPVVSDADAAVGTGTLTFTFGTATTASGSMTGFTAGTSPAALSVAIDSSNDTLTGIAAAINAKNGGVTATVVTDTSGARLVLKGPTGANAAFTVNAAEDTNAPGLATLDFGPSTSNTGVNQTAQDAIVSYDGLSVHRTSNTISDLVTGVKLTLKSVSVTAVTVSADRPTTAITEAVTDFVNAYNALQTTIAEQTDKDSGSLNGDPSVRQMAQMLSGLTSTPLRASGNPATLAEIGVSTNEDGSLSLDTDALSAALTNDPDAVEAMFNPSQSSSSALVRIVSTTGSVAGGNYSVTDLDPATAGTLTGTASPTAFASPLVLDATNNVFHVALNGAAAVDVTVPAASYSDGASFALALQSAIQANSAITVNASVGWNSGTGTLSAASKTLGKTSSISISAADSTVGDTIGLTGATTTTGVNAAGMIDGKPATASGSLLFADSTTAAAGLVIQPLAGAGSATINIDSGLYNALQLINTQLTSNSGALYTANEQLTEQQTEITAEQQKVTDDASTLTTQLTQQFATMDSKVAAYKSTQSFLTQQIAVWDKSDNS